MTKNNLVDNIMNPQVRRGPVSVIGNRNILAHSRPPLLNRACEYLQFISS